MTFDREIAMIIALAALCAILMLMLLHVTEVIAAPSVKCQATPPQGYASWRIVDGKKCWYLGRRQIDKGLLYWEREKPLEIEEIPLPIPAPAIRAQSDFEDRWEGLRTRENLLEPTQMEGWKLWQ